MRRKENAASRIPAAVSRRARAVPDLCTGMTCLRKLGVARWGIKRARPTVARGESGSGKTRR
ncbi:hypothetical protein ACE1SV_19510 [Streptomyces sennicomposti]